MASRCDAVSAILPFASNALVCALHASSSKSEIKSHWPIVYHGPMLKAHKTKAKTFKFKIVPQRKCISLAQVSFPH